MPSQLIVSNFNTKQRYRQPKLLLPLLIVFYPLNLLVFLNLIVYNVGEIFLRK